MKVNLGSIEKIIQGAGSSGLNFERSQETRPLACRCSFIHRDTGPSYWLRIHAEHINPLIIMTILADIHQTPPDSHLYLLPLICFWQLVGIFLIRVCCTPATRNHIIIPKSSIENLLCMKKKFGQTVWLERIHNRELLVGAASGKFVFQARCALTRASGPPACLVESRWNSVGK